ncbi:hypothetical protein SCHPADRAFT_967111 [Schizopora paradoxa]|uniref:NmrA-like domain-containing protein n=1 Tax=Schizopora paradoxa TaxID=27342 RepID=A0A0H2RPX5_9AGAM|nr:hypothetical protein SCHPADRAFT_967111 [Schizopora paradoxa]
MNNIIREHIPTGKSVTEVFLSAAYRPQFSRVVVFTRNATSSAALGLAAQGAEIVKVTFDDEDPEDAVTLKRALVGVDVVVNAIVSTPVAAPGMKVLVKAVVDAGVKVYFPSEFGVDRRLNAFEGFDMAEWYLKVEHLDYIKEISKRKDFKVVLVYTGLFLEDSLIVIGFHFKERRIEAFGSPDSKVAYTSKVDIGRSVAQLSLLSLSPDPNIAATVPLHVRIAGSNPSFTDIKHIFEKAYPQLSPIHVESLDLDEQREILKQDVITGRLGKEDNGRHLKLTFGEGKLDWSKENSNEIINPGEKLWKWKTIDEFVAEGGVKI